MEKYITEVDSALCKIYDEMYINHFDLFTLLVGNADIIPGLSSIVGTDCVIGSEIDRYYDKTRNDFYLRYVTKNYSNSILLYEGESGLDNLHIEMMIYSHIWESEYFLKILGRIAIIISENKYEWSVNLPPYGKTKFINEKIIKPLGKIDLGRIINLAYDTEVRNSFSHSSYCINLEDKSILLRSKENKKVNNKTKKITFAEFQSKFLYSIILLNRLQYIQDYSFNELASKNMCLTKPIATPDGKMVQVYAEFVQIGNILYPEFKLVKIK